MYFLTLIKLWQKLYLNFKYSIRKEVNYRQISREESDVFVLTSKSEMGKGPSTVEDNWDGSRKPQKNFYPSAY